MNLGRQVHDLHTGDSFSFELNGSQCLVNDGDYIDYWGVRQVLYSAEDGQLHAHAANHDPVWLIVPDESA